jgi:hypothetical protein
MNYDELLAALNAKSDSYEVHALRAVVEIHKPDDKSYSGVIGCIGCGFNSEYGTWEQDYPCPTIQAIEKELK